MAAIRSFKEPKNISSGIFTKENNNKLFLIYELSQTEGKFLYLKTFLESVNILILSATTEIIFR